MPESNLGNHTNFQQTFSAMKLEFLSNSVEGQKETLYMKIPEYVMAAAIPKLIKVLNIL